MNADSQKTKISDFWGKYEAKLVLILGLILVAVISFEVGALKGSDFTQKPLIIEKPAESTVATLENSSQAQNLASTVSIDPTNAVIPPSNCAFVASKNSTKYHLPTCRYAKSIKPENLVCFSSADEAQSKGYVADKNCIK